MDGCVKNIEERIFFDGFTDQSESAGLPGFVLQVFVGISGNEQNFCPRVFAMNVSDQVPVGRAC